MKNILLGLILGLMFLTGCATVWVHQTKGEQEFYADSSECEAKAGQATGGQPDPYYMIRQRVYDNCMKGNGWRQERKQ